MTEPEELEDDLFADLYDGDDASKPQPAVAEGFEPEPAQVPPPVEAPPAPDPVIDTYEPPDEPMNGQNFDEDAGGGWNGGPNGVVEPTNYRNEGQPEPEPESRPIGIKEDG